jgi:hypothetical protein
LYYTSQYEPTASEKKDGKAYDIYGWDTITVNVKKKVTGKKKKTNPSTGTEYDVPTFVETDDDGNLVEKELPVSIEIQVPPSKTEYSDGDTILISGMVVKAYYADGSEWGTVPNSEITIDPTTASGGGGGYESDLDVSPLIEPIAIGTALSGYEVLNLFGQPPIPYWTRVQASRMAAWYDIEDEQGYEWVVASQSSSETYYRDEKLSSDPAVTGTYPLKYSYTYDGKTVYYDYGYSSIGAPEHASRSEFSDVSLIGTFTNVSGYNKQATPEYVAWTMIYGHSTGDSQTITVKWTPDGGEDELTDTFDISVTARANNGGGGR